MFSDIDKNKMSSKIQGYLKMVDLWAQCLKIKINELVIFLYHIFLRLDDFSPVFLNNNPIPPSFHIKYLGLVFNRR